MVALPPISCTLPRSRIPTSLARPLGPCVTPPPNAEKISANWADPAYEPLVPRPAVRGKFDQYCEAALEREGGTQLQVAGQVFFVTNGEPTGFWDLPRVVYRFFDEHFEKPNTKRRLVLPQGLGLVLASAAEWWAWLMGKEPGFTRYRVTFSCAWRCFNIERTRRVLGYEPQVGLEEGIKKTFEVRCPRIFHPRSYADDSCSVVGCRAAEAGGRQGVKGGKAGRCSHDTLCGLGFLVIPICTRVDATPSLMSRTIMHTILRQGVSMNDQ